MHCSNHWIEVYLVDSSLSEQPGPGVQYMKYMKSVLITLYTNDWWCLELYRHDMSLKTVQSQA